MSSGRRSSLISARYFDLGVAYADRRLFAKRGSAAKKSVLPRRQALEIW